MLKGQNSFKRLFTIEESKELLKPFALDFLCIIPFDHKFSKLKPKEFVDSFIIRQFDPIKIIVGYDFSFAYQRGGNFSILKKLAEESNFKVDQVPAYLYHGEPVSSSRIRKLLSLAEMQQVRTLLGRPFSIKGKVIKGKSIGRKLGFPTANLQIKQKEIPPLGVYGGRAPNSWFMA